MVAALKVFPPKGCREANNSITEIIEGAINIDSREPFSAIITFQ
jgi:hypothetical protein